MTANAGSGTMNVFFSPSDPSVRRSYVSSGTYNKIEAATIARQLVASNTARRSVIVTHDASTTLYVGLSSTVTTAAVGTGFPVLANQILGFDDYTGAVFGAVESGAINVKYIET